MQAHRLVLFGVLACGLSSCGGHNGDAIQSSAMLGKADKPVLNLASGTYSAVQSVAITDDTPGAVIYYTTDGTDPDLNSRVYGGPISIAVDLKLKAMAVSKNYAHSDLASADYAFTSTYQSDSGLPKPPTPVGFKIGSVKAPGGLKIVNWAGFRAAITYTFDDGLQADEYPELQATSERMTFFLPCGGDNHTFPVWWQAAKDGQEIGNHTENHCRADGTHCAGGHWAGSIEAEYDECTAYLKQTCEVGNVWTTAAPYGDMGYDRVARTRFFLNRGGNEGYVRADDSSDPYHLPIHEPQPGAKAGTLNLVVVAAVNGGYWRIFALHSLKANTGFDPVDVNELVANISYTKTRGDVWIDSMVNIGAYWMGQELLENATETRSKYATTLTWTVPSHFPAGKYVRVISTRGRLEQGGHAIPLSESGYYDVALDPGKLTILH